MKNTYADGVKRQIACALNRMLEDAGAEGGHVRMEDIAPVPPPDPAMGDAGIALFPYAKRLRKAPARIAEDLARLLNESGGGAAYSAAGPYLNARFDRKAFAADALDAVYSGRVYAGTRPLAGRRVMIEFSSPNTNKPLHLGHLRNDVLGESISRILAAAGADVRKVCIINDRGIHICKSMLAYKEEGGGKTPESEGVKSDRFVGDWYVRFDARLKAEAVAGAVKGGGLMEKARELLRAWEAGDAETVALWKRMNGWAISGMKETYRRTGVSFDTYYYESDTYLSGREEVLRGLEKGVFYREDDGSVWADLTAEGLDKKALLRKDGTSLYITQDFGTAIARRNDYPFDTLIYVVGNEQRYHFQVLFTLLRRLGFDWARDLRHLAYGMVNLPEGRMKTREGTVVDADALLDSLAGMAKDEIREKERDAAVGDIEDAAARVALGAVHYYLLRVAPERDILFNPQESLSFNGETGPYLQYTGARVSSLLKKAGEQAFSPGAAPRPLVAALETLEDAEWELVKTLECLPQKLEEAARAYNPQIIAAWAYELSRRFSRFYHDCPILNAPPPVAAFRLALSSAVLDTLRFALDLVCIPFLEAM